MRNRWIIAALIIIGSSVATLLLWKREAAEDAGRSDPPTLSQRVNIGTEKVRAATTPTESKLALSDVRAALRQMDTTEASDWILAQWKTGEDFATELDLTLDSKQNLSGWPSWRAFLLDILFLIDPETAAAISSDLLQTSQSPDEWAVAMRNLGRLGRHEELLKEKSAELLQRKDWQENPSAGYLEAFDVIVHARQTDLAPVLLDNCDLGDKKAVRHASFLTLDRLLIAAPNEVLPELAKQASQHPQSGLMLSNMIARADVRDEVQRQAVETYLLAPQRTAEELRGFASVFPNANFHISNNLLTHSNTIQGKELRERDIAALEATTQWLADPRFSAVHSILRESQKRLLQFLN